MYDNIFRSGKKSMYFIWVFWKSAELFIYIFVYINTYDEALTIKIWLCSGERGFISKLTFTSLTSKEISALYTAILQRVAAFLIKQVLTQHRHKIYWATNKHKIPLSTVTTGTEGVKFCFRYCFDSCDQH